MIIQPLEGQNHETTRSVTELTDQTSSIILQGIIDWHIISYAMKQYMQIIYLKYFVTIGATEYQLELNLGCIYWYKKYLDFERHLRKSR